MFPVRYFSNNYFAPHYFDKTGLTVVSSETGSGLYGLHALTGDSGITVQL